MCLNLRRYKFLYSLKERRTLMDPSLNSEWSCKECGFALFLPIATEDLTVSRLGLYAEGRFPGRCILAFQTHRESLEELQAHELNTFWRDAVRVGAALKVAVGASRINYAVLGNIHPHHLHIHLIPRIPNLEPLPTRPPWNDPRGLVELDETGSLRIRQAIKNGLRRSAGS